MIHISMSQKDLNRYDVIKRAIRKDITVKKAGELLNLGKRQIYRLKNRVKKEGAKGLIHSNRGKRSNRSVPEEERKTIIQLLYNRYSDFQPTHATEKLEALHHIKRDPKTIRQIMTAEGLWKPRKQRKTEYRSLRPRKEYYGEMEQFDGSYAHWLEDRGNTGELCLLAAIDDATGIVTKAKLVSDEGTLPVFDFWQDYILNHGKPRSIYLDKLRTYYNNLLPERDEEMLTQFQRAMKELGIKPIVAHSPQAKGRVEKLFKTLQDRLVKEMRLKGISDIDTANKFIEEEFLPWFNAKYSVEPKRKANLLRKLSQQEKQQLPAILSRQSKRVVQNDFTIRFNNTWYQLSKEQSVTLRPKERVLLEERTDGSLYMRIRDKYLNYQILPAKPQKLANQPWIIAASQKPSRKPYKPPKDHPWRTPFIFPKRDISKSLKR